MIWGNLGDQNFVWGFNFCSEQCWWKYKIIKSLVLKIGIVSLFNLIVAQELTGNFSRQLMSKRMTSWNNWTHNCVHHKTDIFEENCIKADRFLRDNKAYWQHFKLTNSLMSNYVWSGSVPSFRWIQFSSVFADLETCGEWREFVIGITITLGWKLPEKMFIFYELWSKLMKLQGP